VTVVDSTLLATTTRIWEWGYPSWYSWALFSTTTEALRVRNSTVTLVNSWLQGADRITVNSLTFPRWDRRPAAVIESGLLQIGPYTILSGGTGAGIQTGAFVHQTPGVGQVVRDPRTTLLSSGFQYPTQGQWLHATFHDWIVAGEPYRVGVAGPPNGFALLASGSAAITPLPTSLGLLAIDPTSLQMIGASTLDAANGHHEWNFVCPTNVPNGHVFAFQAAVIGPTGAVSLTLPSPFTVGWQHGRMP